MIALSRPQLADALGAPALRLVRAPQRTRTFLGGEPVTAAPLAWPRVNGRPLSFLAQLDLEELDLSEAAPWLPGAGRLLFFYDVDDQPWGFRPGDRGSWAVVLDPAGPALEARPAPPDLEDDRRVPGVKALRGEPAASLPSPGRDGTSTRVADLTGHDDDDDDLYDAYADLYEDDGEHPRHQVGGFPHPVQNDSMELQCQLVTGGVDCGSAAGYRSPEGQRLASQPNDWRLLLQLDTDDDVGVMWGDAGTLYFWVRERDARAGRFGDVWLVLQCS